MENNQKKTQQNEFTIPRRRFLKKTAATAAAFTIVPRHVLGGPKHTPPSEKLNIAAIAAAGQGKQDVEHLSNQNIVALCDVDHRAAGKTFDLYPKAKVYSDFRKMLEEMDNQIDAVTVSTPDHTHAVAAMTAIKMGKHVYCQKPLTWSVYESRKLTEEARKAKIVTQMGIQHHSGRGLRLSVEAIRAGVIGRVKHVHLWTERPTVLWAQGIDRPGDTPPIPSGLDWDLWLGPAPKRPYHPAYVPFKWRGWWDFGTGAFGNMGCHIMDLPFWALDLDKRSVTIEARTSRLNDETYPASSIVRYRFGPLAGDDSVKVTWYDGGLLPWRPEELETERTLPKHGGLYVGEKGKLLIQLGSGPRLIPESKMKNFQIPEPTLPKSPGHYAEWVNACKGGPKPLADFDYSGPLTEMVLLGNIAIKTQKKLNWDAPNMKVTNVPEANQYLHRQYRKGWIL
jgi:predicted dehydrogenase